MQLIRYTVHSDFETSNAKTTSSSQDTPEHCTSDNMQHITAGIPCQRMITVTHLAIAYAEQFVPCQSMITVTQTAEHVHVICQSKPVLAKKQGQVCDSFKIGRYNTQMHTMYRRICSIGI